MILNGLVIAAILFLRTGHFEFTERAIQWPDAFGLGLFTASGTQLALAQDLPAYALFRPPAYLAAADREHHPTLSLRDRLKERRGPGLLKSAPDQWQPYSSRDKP